MQPSVPIFKKKKKRREKHHFRIKRWKICKWLLFSNRHFFIFQSNFTLLLILLYFIGLLFIISNLAGGFAPVFRRAIIFVGFCVLFAQTTPYIPGVPQVGNTFNPYFSAAPIMPTAAILGPDPNNPLSMAVQQTVVTQQKMPRTADRLEVRQFFVKIALIYGVSDGNFPRSIRKCRKITRSIRFIVRKWKLLNRVPLHLSLKFAPSSLQCEESRMKRYILFIFVQVIKLHTFFRGTFGLAANVLV